MDRHGEIVRTALLIRKVEERLLELFVEGRISGTVHTCVGQELIGPCVMNALKEDDFVVSNHRGHGHYIARTGDVHGLIAELMGRVSGASGGIGGSQHLRNRNYLSNGIQGGMTPIAAGVALARQIQQRDGISIAFIGDGTLGEGIIYETFNLCAKWRLPVLFVLENNHYAQSTSMKQTFAGNVPDRVEGFGLRYFASNVWDLDDLTKTAGAAADSARNQIPCLLEIDSYRLNSHSKGDDNRHEHEVVEHSRMDILTRVLENPTPELDDAVSKIKTEVDDAVNAALTSPLLKSVTGHERQNNPVSFQKVLDPSTGSKRINELTYDCYKDVMTDDDGVVILGEDIEYETAWTAKPYGGAFKVTRNLSKLFAGRVRNTPISEAAIVGVGTGLAIGGLKPTIEIMFGDFMTLAFDQLLNHACKFCEMFGVELAVPLVIRTPMGGRRGYGPTHSQSLERHFLGVPNLSLVAPNRRVHPKELYGPILKQMGHPVIVIENKVLYTHTLKTSEIHGFSIETSDELFPTLRISPGEEISPDVTVVCYGGMLDEVEQAVDVLLDENDIVCEVICPTLISPLNSRPIIDSVRRSGRLLVVEEGGATAGWGSEVVATVTENGVLPSWFRRIGCDSIIPCCAQAEKHVLPDVNDIVKAIREMQHGK